MLVEYVMLQNEMYSEGIITVKTRMITKETILFLIKSTQIIKQ